MRINYYGMKNTFRLINVIYRDTSTRGRRRRDAPKKRTGDRTDHPMDAISKRDSATDRSNFCLVDENETDNYSTRTR